MKHEYYEILASRDKDNDLSAEEKAIFTSHLFNCKECQKLKTEFSSLSSFLGGDVLGESNNKKVIFSNFKKHILSAAAILIVACVSLIAFMGDDKSKRDYVATGTTESTSELVDDATLSNNIDESVLLSAYFNYAYLDESESDEEYDIASSYFSYTSSY